MDISLPASAAMEQATVAAGILGIVLDDGPVFDDPSCLTWRDHSLWARHLPNRVGQKEDALRRRPLDLINDPS